MNYLKIDLPDELCLHYHHKEGCVNIPIPSSIFLGLPSIILNVEDGELLEEIMRKLEGKYKFAGEKDISEAMKVEAEIRDKLK